MLHLLLGVVLAIDPVHSKAQFAVQHIFVERVTGTVPIVSGTIDVPAGSLIPTSVTAVLDPKKFHSDEPDRDAAMQTPDWFDTPQYPTWTFTSTKITPAPKGFTMDGTLTIRGMPQLEHLTVVATGDPTHPHYVATGEVDRKQFGMIPTRLDPVIGNPVDVTLDVVTQPQ
jgi:polyisoprenoid-binding protein YceI